MLFDRNLSVGRRVRQANLLRVEALRCREVFKVQLKRQVLRSVIKDHHAPLASRLLAAQRLRTLTG